MKIAIVKDRNNDFRVHAAGCADVKRDENRHGNTAWIIDVPTRRAANRDMWSDIASDRYPEGTPEHTETIEDYAAGGTFYLSCVQGLPYETPDGQEN